MTELFHLFASRPVVDTTPEVRRGDVEPLTYTDPAWVRRVKIAANVAAGAAVCGLPVCFMIWEGWL